MMKRQKRYLIIASAFAVLLGTQVFVVVTVRKTERGLNWSLNRVALVVADMQRTLQRTTSSSSAVGPRTPPRGETLFASELDHRVQAVAQKYDMPMSEARGCLVAFVALLNLDHHDEGLELFADLGGLAGAFLLDELKSTTGGGELRPSFIAAALSKCLTPDVESGLVAVAQDDSLPHYVRKHAVSALSNAKTAEAHEFLIVEFMRLMNMTPNQRYACPYYKSIVGAVGGTKNNKAVAPLLRLINEERDGRTLDNILSAITALGRIGDNHASPVLKDLAEAERWKTLTPTICLALARIGDEDALPLAHEAQRRESWSPYHMAIFKQVKQTAQKHEKPQQDASKNGDVPALPIAVE